MKKVFFVATLMLSIFCQFGFSKSFNNPSTHFVGAKNDTLIESFTVKGNATSKNDIESILKNKDGVISVSWDDKTGILTVKFMPSKIPLKGLHSELAMAGYDTSFLRAKQSAYDALPQDKKYTRDPQKD